MLLDKLGDVGGSDLLLAFHYEDHPARKLSAVCLSDGIQCSQPGDEFALIIFSAAGV